MSLLAKIPWRRGAWRNCCFRRLQLLGQKGKRAKGQKGKRAKGQKDSRNLRNNNNKLEQKGAFIFNSFMALNFLTLVAVVWNDCVRDRIA